MPMAFDTNARQPRVKLPRSIPGFVWQTFAYCYVARFARSGLVYGTVVGIRDFRVETINTFQYAENMDDRHERSC